MAEMPQPRMGGTVRWFSGLSLALVLACAASAPSMVAFRVEGMSRTAAGAL